jgi:Outer membrane protein beta-barrel domain
MVRIVLAVCVVLILTVPALAQEDYPKIQTSMGYANLGFLDFNSTTGSNSRHSGFVNQTGFNLTKTYGLDNYMGIYSLGQGVTLIADFFGGKATFRTAKVAPYALAGLGVGYFTQSTSYGYGATSSFATRYGAGVDVPINDTMAWKVEVSRMNFHITLTPGNSWNSGTNIATGIVFTLAQ